MLLKLPEKVITEFWDGIKQSILESVPEDEKIDTNVILNLLLSKRMDCWVVYQKEENIKKAIGIITTTFLYDSIFNSKTMLIYSLYGIDDKLISMDIWKEELERLKKYAKSEKCNTIIAYTDNQYVLDIVKSIDGTVKTFIKFNF